MADVPMEELQDSRKRPSEFEEPVAKRMVGAQEAPAISEAEAQLQTMGWIVKMIQDHHVMVNSLAEQQRQFYQEQLRQYQSFLQVLLAYHAVR
eukprot:TRINITY_DN13813_c0_g1_i2.p1 TRINITY_DN13813_c0_g1~~TRINITY_DN13813_c0_g1_i2.p1  ORF type:complete len:102 (+),score=22.24 TRINITY_DN13813_c0_g1_i2:30-308(+)